MKDDALRYVTYQCSACKAEDTNKYFPEEPNWSATTCWKCGAGKGKDLGGMLKSGHGMFPVSRRSAL